MYGQTGSGKTYTMLGDYSKEIRDNNIMSTRGNARMRSSGRSTFNQSNSLQRNSSFGTLPNKSNFGASMKNTAPGLQKQTSTPCGLPPKAAGLQHQSSVHSENNQSNIMNFEYYLRN